MGECEKCGVPCRKTRRIQTGMYFGRPIFKEFCSRCAKEVNEENQKEVGK